MAKTLATVTGTALVPGVSRNNRLYTADLIGKAVARAKDRLADPDGRPLTMRVAHPDPESEPYAPVTEIVGRITDIWQEPDGRARFKAALADNRAGRDVLSLVDTRGGAPFLRNVSIRGSWLGEVRQERVDGRQADVADDMELEGLDFVHRPGVEGARIEQVTGPSGKASEAAGGDRRRIIESVEETQVTDINEAAKAPYGDVVYADPGYQKDGKKRYPVDTKAHARSAWAYINQSDNAKLYTAAQLKRIRAKIVKALKGFGVQVEKSATEAAGGWLLLEVAPTPTPVAEMYAMGGDEQRSGSFSACLDNGMVCVNVSSYCVDPHDLTNLGRAAMDGAIKALLAMDPDDDGDIDVPGAPRQDTDHGMDDDDGPAEAKAMAAGDDDDEDDDDKDGDGDGGDDSKPNESAPADPVGAAVAAEAASTETPASTEDAEPTTHESEVSAMAETTPAAEATTAAPAASAALTQEALAAIVSQAAATAVAGVLEAQAAKKAEKAAKKAAKAEKTAPVEAAPATPQAPAVTESEEDRVNRLVQEKFTALVQGAVAGGSLSLGRKGIVGKSVGESAPLVGLGEGDAELNEHGLPRSWAGDKAAHELGAEQRRHMSAALAQNIIGHRV